MLPDAAAVGSLRDQFDEVHTWGSGELLRALLAEGLLDRLNLWMYPIALGTGKRLFETGVVPTTFRPAKAAQVFEYRGHGPRAGTRRRYPDGRDGGHPSLVRRQLLPPARPRGSGGLQDRVDLAWQDAVVSRRALSRRIRRPRPAVPVFVALDRPASGGGTTGKSRSGADRSPPDRQDQRPNDGRRR